MFIFDNKSKDFIKTEATVSRTQLVSEETYDAEGNREEAQYKIWVKYTVDGIEYEADYGIMPKREVGEKVNIIYDPKDPNNIASPASPIINAVLIVGGVASLVGGIISAVNAVKRHKKMKEQERSWENGQ